MRRNGTLLPENLMEQLCTLNTSVEEMTIFMIKVEEF